METPETYDEAKARRRQRTIVLVVAAAALCCVCLVVAIAIYSWSSVRGGGTQELPGGQFISLARDHAWNTFLRAETMFHI
jgi:hypothetical protein